MVDTIDTMNANSLSFKDPKKSTVTGAISVPVLNEDTGDRLSFQMSFGLHDKLTTNFTVTPPQSADATRINLDLKLGDVNDTLKDFLQRMDKRILNESTCHDEWFTCFSLKRKLDTEALNSMYQPLVKQNLMYGDSTRVKIVLESEKNKYATRIFVVTNEDVEGEETIVKYKKGDYTDLVKGTQCIVTVEVQGLWFAKQLNNFGMSLTATTVLVWKAQSSSKRSNVPAFSLGDTVLTMCNNEE